MAEYYFADRASIGADKPIIQLLITDSRLQCPVEYLVPDSFL